MEHIKVHFTGESMWVKVKTLDEDGSGTGVLDNKPVCSPVSLGDEVRWKVVTQGDLSWNEWIPDSLPDDVK